LSTQGKARHRGTAKRCKPSLKLPGKQAGAGRLSSDRTERELLRLVQAGVEKFILKSATVEDFARTIRMVMEKEKTYSHQLTKSVFTRIVKEAIRKQKLTPPR
jgi:DNA-binding NarL/FixJ family response regulator